MSAFPVIPTGRLPHYPFRGLLGVHSRYGLSARQITNVILSSKTPAASLPPPPLRLLPAGTTSCRAGIIPAEEQRLFTAYVESRRGAVTQGVPFPRPAHRTGRADFPHPALGEGVMFQPTGSLLSAD